MEFYLKYDGPLKSNAGPKDKHRIREYLYPQMKKLWDIEPLKSCKSQFLGIYDSQSVLIEIDGITFAPLVSKKHKFICQLDITMLWPEEQGVISKVGGDIDNRLKTLFDALQCPDVNQIKPVKERFADKQPFFCLLENDKLITSVNIKTHTLLRSVDQTDVSNICVHKKLEEEKLNDKECETNVSVLIHVVVKTTNISWDTIGLSG